MKLSRFLILFVCFNILLAGVPLFLQEYHQNYLLIPRFWNMFAVFSIITFVVYIFASWRMNVSLRSSGQALLASIAVKLLLYMVIAFVYISQNRVEPVQFLFSFFYLYFFHTVFEIYCLLRNLRNQNFK